MKFGYLTLRINKMMVIISLIAILLLIFVIVDVFAIKNDSIDKALFGFAESHRNPSMTAFMRIITFLGKHTFLIPANILLLLFFVMVKERWWAIQVAVLSLTSLTLMSFLKNWAHRIRPDDSMIDGITNFSFPSGHATMSVAFYGLLICWFDLKVKSKFYRALITTTLIVLMLLIGYSRIYLRVHYATDVIAGFCIGSIWLIFCLAVVKALESRHTEKRNGIANN